MDHCGEMRKGGRKSLTNHWESVTLGLSLDGYLISVLSTQPLQLQ